MVGIWGDLIGALHPQLDIEPWPALLKLQVEVQAEARRWPCPSTATLEGQRAGVNDHFGKPSLTLGVDDFDFRHLQSTGQTRLSGSSFLRIRMDLSEITSRGEATGRTHSSKARPISYGAREPGCARLPDLVNRRTVWFSHRSVF